MFSATSSFVFLFSFFHHLEHGVFLQSSGSCNFFRWYDEEVVHPSGNEEGQTRFELDIADLEFNVAKLKRKLIEERTVRRLMTIVIIVYGALTVGLCIFCSIKCVGS